MIREDKKLLLCVSLLLFLLLPLASSAAEPDPGPETMNLKERFAVSGNKSAVIFPHRIHQQALGQECVQCHISPQGGGKLNVELTKKDGISNDYHKKFCWACHEKMNVPKGKMCTTCHK